MASSSAVGGSTTSPSTTTNRSIDKLFINGETFDIGSNEGGMKVFVMSSNTDYTTATAARTYAQSGKACAIRIPGMQLFYPASSTGEMWINIRPNVNGTGSSMTITDHGYYVDMMAFKVVSGSVTGIVKESVGNKIVSSSPSSPTAGVLYFITE